MSHVHPFIVLFICQCMIEILLKGYKSYSPFHIGILFAAPVFAAPFFFYFILLLFFFFM